MTKKIPTFRSIGVKFSGESERYVVRSIPRASKTTIKDIVEMMLLPRIKTVLAGGKYTGGMHSQDNLWYNALPLFNKYDVTYSNDSRDGFKTCIRDLCKEHGVAREQIGLYASPWGAMYYRGQWHDISFDTIKELAKKGTDIIFIEKRDVVQSLGKYASKWGVALVNTHGHLSKYTEDLAELANIAGANIALLTDYDVPGILIASKLPDTVPRLGIDESTLDYFHINDKEDTTMVIPYIPKVKRIDAFTFHTMVKTDKRFKGKVDTDFLGKEKIEIDAVIAKVGEEKFWDYLQKLLGEKFKTRNYLRVIEPRPDLSKHYPEIVKKLNLLIESHAKNITDEESEKIAKELEKVEGFIEIKKKEEEILDERLGKKILQQDQTLNDIADSIEEIDQEHGFGISDLEIPPEDEKEEEEIIPDPTPLEHIDAVREAIQKTGMSESLFTKYHYVYQCGSPEIKQKLVELESNDEWGLGEWNGDEEELETYEDRAEQARTKHIDELYNEVIRQFRQEHNNRLPWQQEQEEDGGS